ncbi:hypothetical protein RHMOL_Rhmol12G0212800 [Rhododendron molle]|uniref:Uncharacterized protein n=1 Tax=Rhododendron molle TaxID=49168 RepID=A0ACC0LLT4_RHOML|nr:hypothetical protein RHMOL_Rhmol12G0212800 [Rhododendron molle]
MATRYSAVRNPASSLWSRRFQDLMTASIPSVLLSTRFLIPNISWKQESRKQEPEKLMQDQDTLRSSILQRCYASYGRFVPQSAFENHSGHSQTKSGNKLTPTCALIHSEGIQGFQFVDAHLHCMFICREHPEIWPAAIFLVIELYFSLLLLSFALAPSMESEKKLCGPLRSFSQLWQHPLTPVFVVAIFTVLHVKTAALYWKYDKEGGMGSLGGDGDGHPFVSFTINLL